LGHSRKHPYHPHEGNRKLTPPPFGCPNTFTIIRNNIFSPPPPDGRNFLRGGVWIFSGATHFNTSEPEAFFLNAPGKLLFCYSLSISIIYQGIHSKYRVASKKEMAQRPTGISNGDVYAIYHRISTYS
jgi:hypothetical protein